MDWSSIDLRFLPYFLTAEKVEIEWKEGVNFRTIDKPKITRFYVGLITREGQVAPVSRQVIPHYPHFVRNKRYNSIRSEIIPSDKIKTIRGLGVRNPIFKDIDMDRVIRARLNQFVAIREIFPFWINHGRLMESVKEFSDNY